MSEEENGAISKSEEFLRSLREVMQTSEKSDQARAALQVSFEKRMADMKTARELVPKKDLALTAGASIMIGSLIIGVAAATYGFYKLIAPRRKGLPSPGGLSRNERRDPP